jgi:hypothetical protein
MATYINATSGIPQYSPSTPASFGFDSFGRTKTSQPYTLFDNQHRYTSGDEFSDITSGTAAVSFLVNESTDLFTIGTASGDKIYRESKKCFPYQPGKALTVMQTFVMAPTKTGLRQRVGYFSRQNGVYLQQSGSTVSVVRRTFTSGAIEEEIVNQANWNVDTMNGLGPSRLHLDLTKAQILFMEFEWLGVGSAKVGFAVNGQFITVHQFNHANIIDKVYMTTATLPLRYEIENIAATASSSAMKQICATVLSNGGYDRKPEVWSASRNTLFQNVGTTFVPLAAVRLKAGRMDSVVQIARVNIATTSNNLFEWALLRNPAITGGTWVENTPTQDTEYNITATSLTNGIVVRRGFLAGSNQNNAATDLEIENSFDLQLGRTNSDTPVSDIYCLAIRTVSSTGDAVGSIQWHELI